MTVTVIFLRDRSYYVAHTGHKLLGSSDHTALVSQIAGTAGTCYCAWLLIIALKVFQILNDHKLDCVKHLKFRDVSKSKRKL